MDAGLLRNGVGGEKADAFHLIHQCIRIFLNLFFGILPINAIDFLGGARTDAKPLEIEHGLLGGFLRNERFLNFRGFHGTDAAQLQQNGRLFPQNRQHIRTVFFHQLVRAFGTDVRNGVGGKIALQLFCGRGLDFLKLSN